MTNLLNILLKELEIKLVRSQKKKPAHSLCYIFYICSFDKLKINIKKSWEKDKTQRKALKKHLPKLQKKKKQKKELKKLNKDTFIFK